MVRKAKLAWWLLQQFSEFKMAASDILNFDQFSTFDLDDIEGRVIPLYSGFPGRGVHFWSYFVDTGST